MPIVANNNFLINQIYHKIAQFIFKNIHIIKQINIQLKINNNKLSFFKMIDKQTSVCYHTKT